MAENAEYYQDWSESYRASARNVKDRIDELKNKLETAQEDEAARLNGSIMTLQESYYDCLHVADILKRKALIEASKALRTENCV